MPRYALLIQYDGSKLSGSQRQANALTVQGEIEKALRIYYRSPLSLILASRTDAGVHARGMVGHVDLPESLSDPFERRSLCLHLSGILRKDIAVLACEQVASDFHARNQAIRRTYQYYLRPHSITQPLDGGQVTVVPAKLSLDDLNALAQTLIGRHDFRLFSRETSSPSRPVCDVSESYWYERADGVFIYRISADHFLYRMIRTIVGTKIALLSGNIENLSFENTLLRWRNFGRGLLLKEDFPLGSSAPAKGLCLEKITYPIPLFDHHV
ncbi:MAG: tRNA pseudouridine synthase A [Candidatus Caenarcaniphilales bacterium]|nr:tRNA pseudouridine synthase A [Candidatus Caenarcaniphilales bacterium]